MIAILHRDLRNWVFFSSPFIYFSYFIWTFISPFLFGRLYPFSIWTFVSLFYLDFYFPFFTNRDMILDFFFILYLFDRGHIFDFFQIFKISLLGYYRGTSRLLHYYNLSTVIITVFIPYLCRFSKQI